MSFSVTESVFCESAYTYFLSVLLSEYIKPPNICLVYVNPEDSKKAEGCHSQVGGGGH